MSAGRTYWLAFDARWLAREGVVEVREECGHAAVTVLLALMGQAKLENDGGHVTTGYRALAREAFLDGADEARNIVAACVAAGLLDEHVDNEDGKRFSCRLSGWVADQTKGRAAHRKARERSDEDDDEAGADDEGQGETSHGLSRPVTGRHAPVGTGQHSTEQQTSTSKDLVEPDRPDDTLELMKATVETQQLCSSLAQHIKRRDPKFDVGRWATSTRWLKEMRLLVADRDGDVAEIQRVLDWSQQDEFWQRNILSPLKLRRQFTALVQQAGAGPTKGAPVLSRDEFAQRFRNGTAARAAA